MYESLREDASVDWGGPGEELELKTILNPEEEKHTYIEARIPSLLTELLILFTQTVDADFDEEENVWTFAKWKEQWTNRSLASKIFYAVSLPFSLLLALTIPNVKEYNRFANMIVFESMVFNNFEKL